MLMLSVLVRSRKIADLTDAATIRPCGTTVTELRAPIIDKTIGTAPPQILGHVAYSTGESDGLLVWSRVVKREKNLVLFPDRLGMNYEPNDPNHDLPAIHPAVRAAVDILMGIADP